MRFIVDESTGGAVVEYLRTAGHDMLAVAETLPQSDDRDILSCAMNERRILITNDKDFGELVFRSGQMHHGVVLLRLNDESAANRVRVMKSLLGQHAERLAEHFAVATETGVRIRPARTLS
jgi:predicted nuclease of predicted toxin-antitoxin system